MLGRTILANSLLLVSLLVGCEGHGPSARASTPDATPVDARPPGPDAHPPRLLSLADGEAEIAKARVVKLAALRFPEGRAIWSAPVRDPDAMTDGPLALSVAGDVLVVQTWDMTLAAFRLDGRVLWSAEAQPTAWGVALGPDHLAASFLESSTRQHALTVFDEMTGRVVWSEPDFYLNPVHAAVSPSSGWIADVRFEQDVLVYYFRGDVDPPGPAPGLIRALDARTGRPLWSRRTGNDDLQLAVAPGLVLVRAAGAPAGPESELPPGLVALRLRDGSIAWSIDESVETRYQDPIVCGERVFWNHGVRDPEGRLLWRNPALLAAGGKARSCDGRLALAYDAGSSADHICVVDLADGSVRYVVEGPAVNDAYVTIQAGLLLVRGDLDSHNEPYALRVLDAETGAPLWQHTFRAGLASEAVATGDGVFVVDDRFSPARFARNPRP